MLFKKFMIPPMVAVPPRGAIKDGIDQPTGAAAASPLSATEIQRIAQIGSVVNVAPNTATPSSMPRKAWSCALLRSHNLQSPENHREILADTKLRKIFGKVKVTMFEMNKHLAQHVK